MHRTKKFHYSLQAELTFLFLILVVGTIGVIWLANNFFLGRYYSQEKQGALEAAYESLNEAALNNSITSSDFDAEILRITGKDNLSVIVMNNESQTVKYYAPDPDTMVHRMWDNLLENTNTLPEDFDEKGTAWDDAADKNDYFIVRQMVSQDNLRLQIVLDKKTRTQYMERWGILDDGSYYLMRAAMESIMNSSRIANRFIGYLGLLAILVGLFISLLLGNRITRPIRQITQISQRMKKLDFSAKYQGEDRTEIAVLGDNINELSQTLEETISELKTANHKLELDLEQKNKTEALQREFISNVTHELKTPIALIQGYAEGLSDGIAEDPESQKFYLDTITEEAGKMNTMVQKLLGLMHLEFGQTQVNVERFDVVDLIQTYMKTANLLADHKDVKINITQTQPDGNILGDEEGESLEPAYVWSDSFLVQEVFQNYFTNALNHVEEVNGQDKVIDIRFEQKENCCRVSVFNTGRPIPEESLPRIWEKFYKVDKARTRQYGGSGVGLSIVKAIMDLLHEDFGAINYDNGVEFYFNLDTNSQNDMISATEE